MWFALIGSHHLGWLSGMPYGSQSTHRVLKRMNLKEEFRAVLAKTQVGRPCGLR
jgi:hypothetical protein